MVVLFIILIFYRLEEVHVLFDQFFGQIQNYYSIVRLNQLVQKSDLSSKNFFLTSSLSNLTPPAVPMFPLVNQLDLELLSCVAFQSVAF